MGSRSASENTSLKFIRVSGSSSSTIISRVGVLLMGQSFTGVILMVTLTVTLEKPSERL